MAVQEVVRVVVGEVARVVKVMFVSSRVPSGQINDLQRSELERFHNMCHAVDLTTGLSFEICSNSG